MHSSGSPLCKNLVLSGKCLIGYDRLRPRVTWTSITTMAMASRI
jgi:hypothetical protein